MELKKLNSKLYKYRYFTLKNIQFFWLIMDDKGDVWTEAESLEDCVDIVDRWYDEIHDQYLELEELM